MCSLKEVPNTTDFKFSPVNKKNHQNINKSCSDLPMSKKSRTSSRYRSWCSTGLTVTGVLAEDCQQQQKKFEIYISDCIKFRLSKVYLKHCDLGKEAVLILILDSATVLNTYYYLSYGKQILNPIISFVLQYLYETIVDRLYSKYLATDMSFWHKFHDGLSDIYIYKYTIIQDLRFLYHLDMMYKKIVYH